jgi:long-chain acyl-CoA synthetase
MENPASLSVREIDARLCVAGSHFEIDEVEIGGRRMRVWKNAPVTLADILERSRQLGGDRDYLVLDGERLTHAQHHERVLQLAAALVEDFGVEKGDRVAIAMRNLPEWSIAFFAAGLIGAIAVPINAFWNGPELVFALEDCDPRVLIADGERLERLRTETELLAKMRVIGTRLEDRKTSEPLPAGIERFDEVLKREARAPQVDVESDDLLSLFYTSGTTNHPKGVLGTHRHICSGMIGLEYAGARIMARLGMSAPDGERATPVILVPVPFFHATGCHMNLVAQAWFGGTVVMMRRWNPEQALDLIERERVTGLSGVPAMAWDLVHSESIGQRDVSSLQSLGGGGAAAPPALLRRIQEVVPDCGSGTGYGMTESSALTASIGGLDYVERPTSVGVPMPICDVRIVDDEGRDAPVGEIGEIWIGGAMVACGYWRRPEATEETFADGWLRSGDLGRLDGDGFLYIVDRAKDMVIRGGENISSLEVEAALLAHPSVLEAAVFAVPHPSLGEEVGAVVLLKSGEAADAGALQRHAAERLAPFKVPTHIWWTDEPLPRGATGKIQKREIKARYLAARSQP